MSTSPMHGENQWSDEADLPNWRHDIQTYWDAQMNLARTVARGLALSLGLSADYVAPFLTNPCAQMVLLRYSPPGGNSSREDHPGCGEHTDCGFLTLLAQDNVGGLEVQHADGHWIQAPPVPGTFVVNMGDICARWTNDQYKSTWHRVFNTDSARVRHSIPFFCNCNYNTPISCIFQDSNMQCVADSSTRQTEEARYEPVLAGDYIMQKLGLMRT